MPIFSLATLISLAIAATKPEVTLRFSHPDAAQVALRIDSLSPRLMTRTSKGQWEIELPALAPGVYTYNFYVGKTSFHDPRNPLKKPVHGGGYESVLEVFGDTDPIWSRKTAPKGRLIEFRVPSEMFGDSRAAMVYLPAGQKTSQRLPVTYLLHGVMDDHRAWTTAGHADAVLENLIRAGRTKPRILVMPLGYATANSEKGVQGLLMTPPETWKGLLSAFEQHFVTELMPAVEHRFNVSQYRADREISGVSMGGAQALFVGLKHPELFARVGSFGGAFMVFGSGSSAAYPSPPTGASQDVQLYCGSDDFTRAFHPAFQNWLSSQHVPFSAHSHAGGHEWRVWIQDLEEWLTSR